MANTASDPTPLLIDMNRQIGGISATLGAIQLQLASDKADHSQVHKDLNARIDGIETKLDEASSEIRDAKVSSRTMKLVWTGVLGLPAAWGLFGPIIRHALGLPG